MSASRNLAPARLAARRLALTAAIAVAVLVMPDLAGSADTPARMLFGAVGVPSAETPRAIGGYSLGCLAGGVQLPADGPGFQTMRPSRNRAWGTPQLVSYIQKLGADAPKVGWRGLLIGDMSQARGGPMLTGHASHQTGLDVDIWHLPMPDRRLTAEERETMSPTSVLKPGKLELEPSRYEESYARLIRQAVSYPEVDRVFVSAAIKRQMCETAGTDRAWLRKVRPWFGHDDHIHVRLACPPGMAGCEAQEPPPPGDDCGPNLAYWFEYHPPAKGPPPPPAPPLTLARLPAACAAVLSAQPGGVSDLTPVPKPRPR